MVCVKPAPSGHAACRFTKARPPGIYKDEYIQGVFRYYRQARQESGAGAIETPLVPAWKPGDDSPENFVDGPDGPKLRDSDDGALAPAFCCPGRSASCQALRRCCCAAARGWSCDGDTIMVCVGGSCPACSLTGSEPSRQPC